MDYPDASPGSDMRIESTALPMLNLRRFRLATSAFSIGMICLHLLVFWMARHQVTAGLPDFRIFYTAGLMIRRGQAHILYNDDVQLTTQREFVSPEFPLEDPLPYNHPPFEALLYVPFTHLPYLPAYSLWFLVNLGLLAVAIHVIRPWVPTLASQFAGPLLLIPLAFFPVAYALMQGQDSILLMVLYCLSYAAFRRRQAMRAGIYLGLGLFKFHLVLPFAFILLLKRQWRALVGVVLSASSEIAVSLALVGWKELLEYPRYAWHVNRRRLTFVIAPENMPNLRGLLTGWSGLGEARLWLELALIIVSFALLVWAARQWKTADVINPAVWDAGISVSMIATFLVGYHGYNQDLSILLLPLLLTIEHALQDDGIKVRTALQVSLGLMFLSPLYLALTLRYMHQNLYALVLLSLAASIAASSTQLQMARRHTERNSVSVG